MERKISMPWGLNSRPLVEDRYHSHTPFTVGGKAEVLTFSNRVRSLTGLHVLGLLAASRTARCSMLCPIQV